MIQVGRINYGMDHFRKAVLYTAEEVVHMVIKCFQLINWLEIEKSHSSRNLLEVIMKNCQRSINTKGFGPMRTLIASSQIKTNKNFIQI